jgi:predicted dehydrogenase
MNTPDVVRVVLIGAGGIGKYHAQLWRETPNTELIGVYDTVPQAAKETAEKHGVKRVYASLEEAVNESRADAIDVCTPNRAHTPVVVAALNAGKHCLCEKPLAATAADIRQMIAARDRSGKLLMTTQQFRFEPRSVALKKLIDAGDLGEVYYTRAWWLRRRRAPTTPGFLSKQQAGHGPGLDIGVHVLDLAMHFLGHPEPATVSGVAVCKLAHQKDVANQWGAFRAADFEVEDFAAAFIRFKNGAVLSLEVSWLLNVNEAESHGVCLHGTAGGAHWPDLKLNLVREGLLLDTQIVSHTGADGHKHALPAFCDAIRTGGPSPVPAEQSLTVARILEALYASAETGSEVRC